MQASYCVSPLLPFVKSNLKKPFTSVGKLLRATVKSLRQIFLQSRQGTAPTALPLWVGNG